MLWLYLQRGWHKMSYNDINYDCSPCMTPIQCLVPKSNSFLAATVSTSGRTITLAG